MHVSEMGLRVVVNPEIPVGTNPARQPGEDLMSYDNKLMDMNMGDIEPGVLKRAHAVLAATHKSFCLHLPLVLKPDHLLITVMQSLALNIQREPEKFAKALGAVEGAKKRQVTVYADPNNPDWNRVFENFRIALGESFGTHVTSQAECNDCI